MVGTGGARPGTGRPKGVPNKRHKRTSARHCVIDDCFDDDTAYPSGSEPMAARSSSIDCRDEGQVRRLRRYAARPVDFRHALLAQVLRPADRLADEKDRRRALRQRMLVVSNMPPSARKYQDSIYQHLCGFLWVSLIKYQKVRA